MTQYFKLNLAKIKQAITIGVLSIGLMACGGGEESAEVDLELQQKTLTVEVEGGGSVGGDVQCSDVCSSVVEHDATIEILATPASGFIFQQWNGACSGTGSCQVVMSSNKTVAAVFVEQDSSTDEFLLSVSKNGFGSVSSSPSGINCGADCSENFQQGTSVTLQATADSGHTFTGWSGGCGGTDDCVVTMNQALTVTANFQQQSVPELFELSVNVTGQGSVSSSPGGINCGSDCNQEYQANTLVTLTATPDAGQEFVGWGGACTGSASCNVTLTGDLAVTAVFQQQGSENFNLTTSVVGNGSINSTPTGIACGVDCSESYSVDTQVTLVATPESGYEFNGWSGACSGTSSCSITMDSTKTVTAEFIEEQASSYDLSVTVVGDGRVTSSPNGIDCAGDCNETYDTGTNVVLTATADPGYEFDYWQGACSGNSNCTLDMDADRDVTARFKVEGETPEILVENYSQQSDAFQLGQIPNNASGITWHDDIQQYLVVQNNAATVYRYDQNFAYLGQFKVSGIAKDTEGLAYVEGDQMMIVSEDNHGSRITVNEFTSGVEGDVPQSQRYRVMSRGESNKGMEGVAVRKPNGSTPARVFACQEGTRGNNMRVVYFDMPADSNSVYDYSTNLTVVEPFEADQAFSGSVTDLAGMVYDDRTDNLIIVSHESSKAIQVDPYSGSVISSLSLNGAPQYEGVTIGPNGELVFVSEGNWIHIFELN